MSSASVVIWGPAVYRSRVKYDGELEELALATLMCSGYGVNRCFTLEERADVDLEEPRWGRLGVGWNVGNDLDMSSFITAGREPVNGIGSNAFLLDKRFEGIVPIKRWLC